MPILVIAILFFSSCENKKLTYYNQLMDIHNNLDTTVAAINKPTKKNNVEDTVATIKAIDSVILKIETTMGTIKNIVPTEDGNLIKQNSISYDSAMMQTLIDIRKLYTVNMQKLNADSLKIFLNDLTTHEKKLNETDSILTLNLTAYRKANKLELAK